MCEIYNLSKNSTHAGVKLASFSRLVTTHSYFFPVTVLDAPRVIVHESCHKYYGGLIAAHWAIHVLL
jgi:hypothetical protein